MAKLKDIGDCNEALRQLAFLEIRIEGIEARCNRVILNAKRTMEEVATPLRGQTSEISKQIKQFCDENRAAIAPDGRKSVELTVGRVGWRQSPPALLPVARSSWAKVLDLLRRLGRHDLIREKASVDKDAVHAVRLSCEELKQLGMRLSAPEKFFYEWDRAKLSAPEKFFYEWDRAKL